MRLSIGHCPHGSRAVLVEDKNGGTRLTPSKCCGTWHTTDSWVLTGEQWEHVANVVEEAALITRKREKAAAKKKATKKETRR